MARAARNAFLKSVGLAAAVLFLAGCAKYESAPITHERVEQDLAPQDADQLKVAASKLQHPILEPLAIDLEKGLTPDDAAVLAVIANPSLRAERDRRNVAAAQLVQAGLLPNPQFVGTVDFPHGSAPPDNFTAYGLGVNWDVTSLIGLDERKKAAAADAQSVALDVAWKEWQVAQAAKVAVYGVIGAESQLKLARELEAGLEETHQVLDRALQEHLKTSLDWAAADAALQDARTTIFAIERDAADRRLALNKALGVPPDAKIKIRADSALPVTLLTNEKDLLASLENRRLDLIALRKGYESEDQTYRAAILGQFPKINVGFTEARDTSNVRTHGLGVSIDLPIFDRNQAVIAEKKATRQKLYDEYVQRVFEARSDLATALADIESVRKQIQAIDAAMPALERLETEYKAAIDARSADVLSYYTARTAVTQRRIDELKLRQELAELTSALEIASGQYLQPAETKTP